MVPDLQNKLEVQWGFKNVSAMWPAQKCKALGKALVKRKAMMTDKDFDDLELKLKAGKVSGKQALAMLPGIVRLLRRRTRLMNAWQEFAKGVALEDRLYVTAWKVWKRKVVTVGASAPAWSRANPPKVTMVNGEAASLDFEEEKTVVEGLA